MIAFSCYPQEKGNGGVGLIKLSGDMRHKEVVPVKSNNKAVLAGSIFHVNRIPDTCSFDPVPQICIPHEPMEVKFPEPTTTTMKNNVQNDKNNEVGGGGGGGKSEETKSASGKGNSAQHLVPKYSLVSSLVICGILLKSFVWVYL